MGPEPILDTSKEPPVERRVRGGLCDSLVTMPTELSRFFNRYEHLCMQYMNIHTRTHARTHIHTYICVYVCVCVYICIYRMSIKYFPDYKHLLQENHVENKHIFLPLLKLVSCVYFEKKNVCIPLTVVLL